MFFFHNGTFQKEEVQLKLFGRLLTGAKDILADYKLSSIEIKDESFLAKGEEKFQMTAIQSKEDVIEGTVLRFSGKNCG